MSRRGGKDVPGICKSRRRLKRWLTKTILIVMLVTRAASIPTDILTQSGYKKTIVISDHTVFTLPDGSSGVLFAGGTIRYTPDFNLHREITIDGSALAQVAPGDKMFTAYVPGGLVIRTRTGTFEVTAIPGDESKVRVRVGTESVELTDLSGKSYGYFHAAEEAIINLKIGDVTRKRYDDVFISETGIRPILRFERMPLADVGLRLESHFGVRIDVSRAVRKHIIDATFPADITLVEALEAIRISNRDRYVKYAISPDGVVTIHDR